MVRVLSPAARPRLRWMRAPEQARPQPPPPATISRFRGNATCRVAQLRDHKLYYFVQAAPPFVRSARHRLLALHPRRLPTSGLRASTSAAYSDRIKAFFRAEVRFAGAAGKYACAQRPLRRPSAGRPRSLAVRGRSRSPPRFSPPGAAAGGDPFFPEPRQRVYDLKSYAVKLARQPPRRAARTATVNDHRPPAPRRPCFELSTSTLPRVSR